VNDSAVFGQALFYNKRLPNQWVKEHNGAVSHHHIKITMRNTHRTIWASNSPTQRIRLGRPDYTPARRGIASEIVKKLFLSFLRHSGAVIAEGLAVRLVIIFKVLRGRAPGGRVLLMLDQADPNGFRLVCQDYKIMCFHSFANIAYIFVLSSFAFSFAL
jgi:hypothetical protein